MLLLLLQHEPEVRRALAGVFQQHGILVETATTGTQTLNKAILISPDAVVMDVSSPEALEAVERLKRRLVTRRIPIVALVDDPEDGAALALGCDAQVRRGCDPDELLAVVRRVRARR